MNGDEDAMSLLDSSSHIPRSSTTVAAASAAETCHEADMVSFWTKQTKTAVPAELIALTDMCTNNAE
jgi:hypothetical protein